MRAGWWDAPLALRDLAKAIPIISGNGLSLLIENNFQNHPPPLLFAPPPPSLLIFRLSVGPPPPPPFLLRPPSIIWNWRVTVFIIIRFDESFESPITSQAFFQLHEAPVSPHSFCVPSKHREWSTEKADYVPRLRHPGYNRRSAVVVKYSSIFNESVSGMLYSPVSLAYKIG